MSKTLLILSGVLVAWGLPLAFADGEPGDGMAACDQFDSSASDPIVQLASGGDVPMCRFAGTGEDLSRGSLNRLANPLSKEDLVLPEAIAVFLHPSQAVVDARKAGESAEKVCERSGGVISKYKEWGGKVWFTGCLYRDNSIINDRAVLDGASKHLRLKQAIERALKSVNR